MDETTRSRDIEEMIKAMRCPVEGTITGNTGTKNTTGINGRVKSTKEDMPWIL
jgi:hypothetical protein